MNTCITNKRWTIYYKQKMNNILQIKDNSKLQIKDEQYITNKRWTVYYK